MSWLGLSGREARLIAWAAPALVLIGWAAISVQTVADALFVKRVGVERLPAAFLISSLLMVGSTYAIGRLISTRDRARLLSRVLALLAAVVAPMWLLVEMEPESVWPVWLLILLSKQIEAIALMVFWVGMGDLLHGRQAKRLFGPLMGGFTLGIVLASFAAKPLGQLIGIERLLLLAAVVLGVAALVTVPLRTMRLLRLERGLGVEVEATETAGGVEVPAGYQERVSALGAMWSESGLFRLLLVATLASGLLGPMVYFLFSYLADLATTGANAEQQLFELYSLFRAWQNVGVLLIQVTVASTLYRRLGIPVSAALAPLVYLAGFGGLSLHLTLPVGMAARAMTHVLDHAVYDPVMRVLFSLFPEHLRSRATAVLEGPVKRLGGALGNLVVIAALELAGWLALGGEAAARWISVSGLPVAAAWLAASVLLWRTYPKLLIAASSASVRAPGGDSFEKMVDPNTIRVLSAQLLSPDPDRCRAAIALVSDAPRRLAVEALGGAAAEASSAMRHLLVAALDRQLEANVGSTLDSPVAAAAVKGLLVGDTTLGVRERADLVQAYGRLTGSQGSGLRDEEVIRQALASAAPAVRLAALAASGGRAGAPDAASLDEAILEAVRGDDPEARRIAREELRSLLLRAEPDAKWEQRLKVLAELLQRPEERVDAAEAIAAVAARHGSAATALRDEMLPLHDDPDERVLAAVLRFVGHGRVREEAEWMVSQLAASSRIIVEAARDGLGAAGAIAASALIREYSFGKRSQRDEILSIVRRIEVDSDVLRELYRRELESIRRTLISAQALSDGSTPPMILQRLEERLDEGLHTALLFLAAIHHEESFAELDDLMRNTHGDRQHAILLEALEAFLSAEERSELLPLFDSQSLDVRARAAAARAGVPIPTFAEATRALLEDPDDLTREIAQSTVGRSAHLAGRSSIPHAEGVLTPAEIAVQIRGIPLFDRLTLRQLMDLAGVAREETHAAGTVICRQGEDGSCMYFITEGEVDVRQDEQHLATLGLSEFFGEMAVFEGVARDATVVARRPTRLVRLERRDVMALIDETPAIAVGILRSLSERVRDLNAKLQAASVGSNTARGT